jgi:hypothetical protein
MEVRTILKMVMVMWLVMVLVLALGRTFQKTAMVLVVSWGMASGGMASLGMVMMSWVC